jgi:hypothetical protein
VATLIVCGELDLVDRDEIDAQIHRHGLDRADPVARARGDALLLTGHQRDAPLAHASRQLVVDLAREQPQRHADHAAVVFQHALERAVRLAGVRRPEQSGDRGGLSHGGYRAADGAARARHRAEPNLPKGRVESAARAYPHDSLCGRRGRIVGPRQRARPRSSSGVNEPLVDRRALGGVGFHHRDG